MLIGTCLTHMFAMRFKTRIRVLHCLYQIAKLWANKGPLIFVLLQLVKRSVARPIFDTSYVIFCRLFVFSGAHALHED
jgi:hypothetical protein